MAGQDRPNPLSISNATMRGLTGRPSALNRTALMTFFGQQVVEEILDAQRAGCPREYENIPIPEGHFYKDEALAQDTGKSVDLKIMPFVRSRYSFNTGYSPNVPREQLNEITPWIDGGLTYGVTKAWADALRSFKDGRLADNSANNEPQFPEQNTLGLPMANPPNPIDVGAARLKDAKRFFKLGNPRGNENPFLLTFGIMWFRWHNYWADKFKANTDWNDERIYNEARKWVIATYQSVVMYEWLPAYLNMNATEVEDNAYTGYKGYVHPGITHEFQSAAMRFGHTLVPPGVMRRNEQCVFRTSTFKSSGFSSSDSRNVAQQSEGNHGVRTCNSFWNPQESVRESDIEEYLLGMASQITEREDNIITEDLQRRVFGPLEFSRRDLMALNIQRGRDHGLPDYNTARESLGMERKTSFDDINPGNSTEATSFIDDEIIDNLKAVYNNSLDKIDIWAGGLLETTSNGPGELFRYIILDQFIRTRDGDRFWFESKANKLFTEEQIEYIKKITLWDIIVACTNISADSLQKDPFHYTEEDPCFAQQPFVNEGRTISETDMENCTTLQTFDYFEGSEVSFALSFLALGIWAVGCVAVLLILAHVRQHRIQAARKMQHRKTRSKDPGNLKTYSAAEWCGMKEGSRQVQVKLGPGKKITISNERGNKLFRMVDLTNCPKIFILVSPDGKRRYMVVKFEREYDIVLKFADEESRLEFISDLESFLGSSEVGVGRERQEIRERELLKVAVTREHRLKLLEKFFRHAFSEAFKLDFDADETLNQKETRDILECELSKTEFAEVLSMKPDSLFVEQMFELVDQDNSGSISFREFLDVIVVFAKGSPDDKLKLMFNMYDIDRSGHLSREEFREMLKSMMEMVSASVEDEKLEDVVKGMFDHAGLGDKDSLSLQDFIELMADHKNELDNAKLEIAGDIKVPSEKQQSGAPPGRGAATVIRRGNVNARARQTIVRAYKDRDTKSGGKGSSNGAAKSGKSGGAVARRTKSIRIETAPQPDFPKTTSSRYYTTFVRYFENNRLKLFYIILYVLVLLGIFIERAYYYSVEREFAGLRRIAGYGVTVTRGAASAMMFTYSCLLVTMCRNLITKLRETFLHRYFPFDEMLFFHKFIALLALFFSVMHTIGHSINFYHISTQTADDLTCYFRDFFHRSHELPKFHYWAWGTITGFTGILLTMVCAVIYTFAFSYARRRVFNLFWFTHNLWVVYFILMFLHGSGRLVQPPFTHYFALGPLILFTLDKLVSISRKKAEIAVTRAELLPSDVTFLEFKRPHGFEYKSGQWVRIACKTLSSSEYHPFTLTSAPHEENLSLHIRAVGPWTMNLRQTYDPNIVREHPLPKVFLDGPYGEGHQDWYQFEVAVLVGGGIGVTPFASILKDIVQKSSIGQRISCKKVYFIWVTRTQKHFEWLTDIIRDVEDNDHNDLVSVHIFITQFFQKFDLRTTMLYICERHFQKISNRSLFTGLKSITHFGRPQFMPFLQSLEDEHPGVGKIGVFSCGPPGMTNGVEQACVELNKYDGAAFIHHFENF